jgi:NADPH-dependent 2,4-dienoyl-CoA reductase/sulfur reductase-like enzyme
MVSEHGLEAPLPFAWGARLGFGVPVHRHSKLVAIHGRRTVEAVEIETMRGRKMIGCDGVILTGRFRPDSALYAGLLEREGEAPRVDEAFRTSLPAIYAAGNILEPLKTAGKTFLQGRAAADSLVKDLP